MSADDAIAPQELTTLAREAVAGSADAALEFANETAYARMQRLDADAVADILAAASALLWVECESGEVATLGHLLCLLPFDAGKLPRAALIDMHMRALAAQLKSH